MVPANFCVQELSMYKERPLLLLITLIRALQMSLFFFFTFISGAKMLLATSLICRFVSWDVYCLPFRALSVVVHNHFCLEHEPHWYEWVMTKFIGYARGDVFIITYCYSSYLTVHSMEYVSSYAWLPPPKPLVIHNLQCCISHYHSQSPDWDECPWLFPNNGTVYSTYWNWPSSMNTGIHLSSVRLTQLNG